MYNKNMHIFQIYMSSPKSFISSKQAASRLGITSSRLRILANQGRVANAIFVQKKGWQFFKSDLTIRPGARGPAFGLNKKAK